MLHTNRLAGETSPYLLQHAHNPVDWYPWSDEALERAKQENKPVLVSIGYAACHWCHVMEKESFEDEATAKLMNEQFINIKIDREERPDLDHIYMDAIQAMTGSGGWPLNVFLTPEGKPFYGGTYFPPKPAFNRASWTDILQQVSDAFKTKRTEIDAQADNLTDYLQKSNAFDPKYKMDLNAVPGEADLHTIYNNCMKNADRQEGGFGNAPKFPQTFTIQYLLRYYHFTKKPEALEQACLSLDKMIRGGIYDQVGGGFARYSTDAEWLAPHFEKMLYDNALLISVLSEAYQITNKKLYRNAIEQTMDFIKREMLSSENGFYSALDADSEGEEGRFYVWSKKEIEEVLEEEADLFNAFYDVSEEGNWEGHNILRIKISAEEFSAERNLSVEELEDRLQKSIRLLLERRAQRVRPSLDDKILLSWNALYNIACSKAYAILRQEEYRQLAISNMEFMLKAFYDEATGGFYHTYKQGKAKYRAFLDDYACLAQALIQLEEITGQQEYLKKAFDIVQYVTEYFSDEDERLFYFTHKDQKDVVVRKKEIYDGATPSANALMAENFLALSVVYNKKEWRERAERMVAGLLELIKSYPSSVGVWACLLLKLEPVCNEYTCRYPYFPQKYESAS
jgi:uncharacterized protein YyaL (SSP411 family)